MPKSPINIVWFKRDLRFTDHEPLCRALASDIPTLLVYFFEPSLIAFPDSDVRHWRFVHESLLEMQGRLEDRKGQLYLFHSEVLPVFQAIATAYDIKTIYSHEEIGNGLSFNRDKEVAAFCKHAGILWKETPTNGVIRRLKSRKTWQQRWEATMTREPFFQREGDWNLLELPSDFYTNHQGPELPSSFKTRNPIFQEGGEYWGWKYLKSFIETRHVGYSSLISKPEASRKACSRISPYLAYGNISMRMAHTYTMQHYKSARNKRSLQNFVSRLDWQSHFIQKFEDESRMEFEPVYKAYQALEKNRDEYLIQAWQTGKTGVPLVDACMRCVVATGYLNFRMRAMVVSFFVFNLWQDWRDLAHFLAQCGHESGGFKAVQENLNYSSKGLQGIFGKYFPTLALAEQYARKPEKIAARVYGGRMGNGAEATGEGFKYRGRGYIQLTGKANYMAFDKFVPEDTTNNPDLVATKYPLASAAWFFDTNKLWGICDRGADDATVTAVTKRVNGGTIGLADRIKHFKEYYNLLK
jgi:deoxyribodipyrimidine photo-lyase